MANIVDPTAVKFANETIRPAADRLVQLYWLAKNAQQQFTAKGLAALIPNDTSLVVDGAATDGRTPITGFDVNVVLSYLGAFVTAMEATSSLELNQVGKVAVNTRF